MKSNLSNLETHLAAAVEIGDQAERDAFLLRACKGDSGRLAELQSMVQDYFAAGSLFDRPAILAPTLDVDGQPEVGAWVGPYKLRELLGEGGMGSVYVAEQEKPVRRKVALKVIKQGMDSRQVIVRFEAERQALALMEHSNIARVLDAGTTDGGRPYFVMELVRGLPITEHCDSAELDTRQRLELFLQVCRAVQHAHQKGVIHRDLKPSNVLVAMNDAEPVVKVIDFGIAKAIGQQLTDNTLYTAFSQMVGTPLYMSPEQAGHSNLDIDTRSDIYSLGVLLYELLTGDTPFDREALKQAGFDEMRRIIREIEPPKPSARFSTLKAADQSTIAQQHRVEPGRFSQLLRGELDWIVMKAMEKDRNRRYESASALGADVERYLHDEPVEACPPSSLYRMTKFAQRNSLALATVCAVVAALLLGTGISLWQASAANRARQLAQQHLESERKARAETVEQKSRLRLQLYATDMSLAPHFWEMGDTARCLDLLERHRPLPEESDLRGFEWHYLWNLAQERLQTWDAHASPILTADASPDDRFIASADRAGVVHIWDLATQNKLQTLQFTDQETCAVRFSPDGLLLATAGQDRVIRLWDVTTWTETARLTGHERTICWLAWSPDSGLLASASRDRSVRIWNVSQQQEVRSLAGHTDVVRCVAWSPDGKLLASAGADMLIRLWDTTTWDPAGDLQGHDDGLLALAFSPCGRWLASAGYGTPVLVHDVGGRIVLAQIAEPGNVWSLVFSPDSNLLVVGGSEGRLDLWRLNSLEKRLDRLHSNRDLTDAFRAVVFVQRGEMLLVASEDDRSLGLQRVVPLVGHASYSLPGTCHTVDGDHKLAATSDASGVVAIRSLPGGKVQQQIAAHNTVVHDVAFSPRGDILASSAADGRVCLFDLQSGKLLHNLEAGAPPVRYLTFSPDGDLLAGGGEEGSVRLWRTATGALLHQLRVPSGGIVQTVFSPDGRRLAAGSFGQVLLWDAVSGNRLALMESTRPGVYGLAFSPDGSLLAVGGDSHVSLWDIAAGEELAVMLGHRGEVWRVAFSPDSQTLATFGDYQTVRLWHVPTRRELFTLLRSDRPLNWLQFTSPRTLMVGMAPDELGVSEVAVFAGNAITDAVGSRIGHTSLPSQTEPVDDL